MEKIKILYDYTAAPSASNQISVKRGDLLDVVKKGAKGQWTKGRKPNGKICILAVVLFNIDKKDQLCGLDLCSPQAVLRFSAIFHHDKSTPWKF